VWTQFGLDFIAHFIAHFIDLWRAARRGPDVLPGQTEGVGTYLELHTRMDEHDPEQKACDMALLDRIASMLRASSSG